MVPGELLQLVSLLPKKLTLAGADGLLFGNAGQVAIQFVGRASSWIFAAVMTFILVKLIGTFMQIKANSEDESSGMDITDLGERAYVQQDQ